MKSMKTIIRLLGVTLLTTVSLSTVVACGTKARTLQNDVDDIAIALKSGVDGSSLDTSKTQADALIWFQAAAIYINKDTIVTLAVPSEATKKLVEGDSLIKVIVTLKTIISDAFDANIVGVK